MEMTLVLSIMYILIVGFLYTPKAKKEKVESINYFPEVTKIDEQIKTKQGKMKRRSNPNQLSIDFNAIKRQELEGKGIRELKKLASQAKIKRYSYLTKAQLIEALSA